MHCFSSVVAIGLVAGAVHAQVPNHDLPAHSVIVRDINRAKSTGASTVFLVALPTDFLSSELALSPEQEKSLLEIRDRYFDSYISSSRSTQRSVLTPILLPVNSQDQAQTVAENALLAQLTPEQKRRVLGLRKDIADFDFVGLHLGALTDLHLTPEQKTQFRTLAAQFATAAKEDPRLQGSEGASNYRNVVREEREALLTDAQRKVLHNARPYGITYRVHTAASAKR